MPVANASVSGALDSVPSAFIAWKAGLSFSCSRIHTDASSSRTDSRKGTRQPQSAKAASPMMLRVTRITTSDRNSPIVAVVWIQLV